MKVALRMDTVVYGHKLDQEVKVDADPEGTPLDQMWRRRLLEKSCTKVSKPKKKSKKPKPPIEELFNGE